MKKLAIMILSLLSLSVYAGEVNVKVSGMVCSMCGQGIKKKFSKLDTVKEINVNLDDKLVRIETKEGQTISDKQIKQLIEEAGYNVANIERK